MNKAKIKKNIFIIFRIIAFFVALLLIMNFLSLVFFPKDKNGFNGDFYNITQSFRAEDVNTIDVFAIGNSDAYRGISPLTMWDECGITASVSGKGMQSTEDAYKLLKELYKKQKPKIVIIETDMVYSFWPDIKKHSTVKKKVSDVWEIVRTFFTDFEDSAISGIGYYYPLISNHSRWQELSSADFKDLNESYRSEYKGFLLSFNIEPYDGGYDYMRKETPSEELTKPEKSMLDKMIKICRKNGSKVVLLELPSAISWNKGKHEVLKRYAEKNGVPFIDYNIEGTLPGFDWKTCTKDAGDHLNTQAAILLTKHLTEFLKSNYSLPDRRQDSKFNSWAKCFIPYNDEIKKIINA